MDPPASGYVGRFAPSPTGPLHAGSLVAALASWLDARAHGGRWLVRIEDVDTPRCVPGMDTVILDQLARCGLVSDAPVLWQSARTEAYAAALAQLRRQGDAYGCVCSRQDVERALAARGVQHMRHGERVYPGTCRPRLAGVGPPGPVVIGPAGPPGPVSIGPPGPVRSMRLLSVEADGSSVSIAWHDRRLGAQVQNLTEAVGDFILRRADGLWAYQLAVVVDDAAQGVTAVVRGEDLADNTARQIRLQQRLGLPTPAYLHTPLVLAADGQKLSKQNGARALALESEAAVLAALREAGRVLGLDVDRVDGADGAAGWAAPGGGAPSGSPAAWLAAAIPAWRARIEAGIIAPFHPASPSPCPPPPAA